MRWVAHHAKHVLKRNITSLVLAGESAGGNLAAVTAAALREAPAPVPVTAQFLVYPTTGVSHRTRSQEEFSEGFFLTQKALDWFNACYAAPSLNPRYDLHAAGLVGMPPTLLVTAELDPLRDEGRAYAAALIDTGVSVIYQEMKGNIHGCFGMLEAIPSTREDVRLGAYRPTQSNCRRISLSQFGVPPTGSRSAQDPNRLFHQSCMRISHRTQATLPS